MAIRLAAVNVIAAIVPSTRPTPSWKTNSGPNTSSTTRATPNAPLLTTATAWSSPETGVGATIATGSHWWSGISPALTPKPMANIIKVIDAALGSEPAISASAGIPPAVKSTVAWPTWLVSQ